MREQVIPILKKIWKVLRWVLLALLIVILLAILTVLFDKYGWSTGINSEIKTVGTDEVYRPTKTLWDWLDLLIVPLVLALGAIWFNIQTRKTERKLESERLAEAVLQSYLEKMTEFLLENQLGSSEPKSKLRVVARAHTLTALRGLDGTRKGILLKFLYETELIIPHTSPDPSQSKGTVIELFLADLSEANLIDAFLKGANLFRVDLKRANLSLSTLIDAHLDGARLEGADLRNANLIGAHLNYVNLSNADLRKADLTEAFITSRADLTRADLRGAMLTGAELIDANLSGADLRKANLWKAKITPKELEKAKTLRDAIMPNGEKYDPSKPLSEQVLPEYRVEADSDKIDVEL